MRYITVIALFFCIVFGISTYTLVKQVAVLEDSVQQYQDLANANAQAVEKLRASCSVTEKVVKDNRDTIDALQKSREDVLGALNSLPQATLPENKVNGKESTTGPTKAFADDSRLSPALMQLLDTAYCSGSKDDSACPAR